jgi:thiol-disulfide isomerase/thioredoxin
MEAGQMRLTVVLVFMIALSLAKEPLPEGLRGDMIPHFFFTNIDGDDVYRDDFKKMQKPGTKRIVLSFFTTWCEICKEEFSLLKKNAGKLEKNGVQVYLVNAVSLEKKGASRGKAKSFAKKYAGDSFPLYFEDGDGIGWGLKNVFPTVIVLDADLKALAVFAGEIGDDFPEVLWKEF